MPWQNGYFYRKTWRDGTCVSEYVGNGPDAELAARLDERERAKRQAERRAWLAITKEQDAIDAQVDEVGNALAALVDSVLLVNGHRQHKRQWRRQRDKKDNTG